MAPVVAVVLGIVLDSISPDQRSRTRFPLGDGSGVTTCPRGGNAQHLWPRTRTPAGGSGTSTCHPDSRRCVRDLHVPIRTPRELSAQLAAREGSGAATCHADAGTGASLPQEAPSPTRIKCEWLRQALLPLGTGQLLSVHTVDRQLPRRLVSYQGKH